MQRNNESAEGDNVAISRLGFTAANWRLFFGNSPRIYNGSIELPITRRFHFMDVKPEILYLDGERWIPSKTYFEFNVPVIASNTKVVYIFQSATDALAYFQIKSMANNDATFFVLGKNPSEAIIRYIKSWFNHARFILCYPNGLMGRISEIKTAGFLSNEHVRLELDNQRLICSYRNRKAIIPLDVVSLSQVSKLTGFYPKKIKTHKPKKGYDSFYDLIRS